MNLFLLAAGVLLLLILLAHSIAGELLVIKPLLSTPNFPRLLGGELLMKTTLRTTWHVASVLAPGAVVIILEIAFRGEPQSADVFVLRALAATFIGCGALALIVTRGKHPSWAAFFAAAALLYRAL